MIADDPRREEETDDECPTCKNSKDPKAEHCGSDYCVGYVDGDEDTKHVMSIEIRKLRARVATLETERDQKIRLAAGVVRVVCGLGSEPLTAREVDNVAEAIRKLAIKARDNRLAASQKGATDGE